VENLLKAHVEVTDYIKKNPDEAKKLLNAQILKDSNASIPDKVIETAWANQNITFAPLSLTLLKGANDAYDLGFLDKKPDLPNIYDLKLLNKALAAKELPPVKGFS